MSFCKKLLNSDLKGFSLLIGSASTGNVGQLVGDLIINSLQMEKFAILFHKSIIPLFGPSAYKNDTNEISTAAEMFINEKQKLILLLLRTPLTQAFLQEFCQEIIQFVKEEGIKEIVQISSVCSQEQHFIDKSPFEYLANDLYDASGIETFFSITTNEKVYGSGIALKLHEAATINSIPSIILYKFVSEGDNKNDSILLFHKVVEFLFKKKVEVKIPISWNHLFGFNVNTEIY